MSEAKFTPGPWLAEMHGNNVLACDQQMMICNVRGWGYLTGTGGLNLPDNEAIKIQDANTRLIAAAPALYEALKNTSCRFSRTRECEGAADHMCDRCAALALAVKTA